MASPHEDKRKLSSKQLQRSSPRHPRNLLQRLSSGLTSMVPKVPLRRVTRSNLFDRPTTEPGPPRTISRSNIRDRLRSSANQQQPIPQIKIPLFSDVDQPCPYDPSRYHSFPSIEPRRCDFCGIRSSSQPARDLEAANSPCINCQSRGTLSHIASTFRRSRCQNSSSSAAPNDTAQLREVSSSLDEAPRLVSAAAVTKRIGNPPRRASLPPGIVTNYGTLCPPPNPHALPMEHSPVQQRMISRPANVAERRSKDAMGPVLRPVSPKLHHIHGLPAAKKYPYVHKREVEAHLAALHAGSPSPLRRSIDEATPSVVLSGSSYDYSETVFYGTSFFTNANRRSSSTHPTSSTNPRARMTMKQRLEESRSITIEGGACGGRPTNLHEELANSAVYRKRTPRPPNQRRQSRHANAPIPDTDSDDSYFSSTVTTQTPSTVGGKRLELRGGNPIPKLRGGNGRQQAVDAGRSYKFKKWLLTCQGPCKIDHGYDTDSDDELPPARIPTPKRVARAIKGAQGRALLPASISRGYARTAGSGYFLYPPVDDIPVTNIVDKVPPARGETAKHPPIPGNPVLCAPTQAHPLRLSSSFFHAIQHRSYRYPELPINRPEPRSSPVPSLRGGTGSTSAWRDTDRLPPALYWLAGGRGKPITVGGWKKQKPGKRIGGLLGMALHGHKAGTDYEHVPKAGGSGSVTTVEIGVGVAASGTPVSNKSSPKSVESGPLNPSNAGPARAIPTPIDDQVPPLAAEQAPAAASGTIPQAPVAAPNTSRHVPVDEQTG